MGNLCNFNCTPCMRSSNGVEVEEHPTVEWKSSFDKVVKDLVEKSEKVSVKGGVSRQVFTSCIYTQYPEFSNHVFDFLTGTKFPMKIDFITTDRLSLQIHNLVAYSTHQEQCNRYLSMYGTFTRLLNRECFRKFIKLIYDISMDLHPDGPLFCPEGENTIVSIVESVFYNKSVCSVGYLETWIELNCPGLVVILHNYVVSGLRNFGIETLIYTDVNETKPLLRNKPSTELLTSKLSLSRIWLLSTLLPRIYTRPLEVAYLQWQCNLFSNTSQASHQIHSVDPEIIPTHWKLLYESSFHGCSANRFFYHVLGYRGPTVTVLNCNENRIFCICLSDEWLEHQSYWGDKFCFLVQLLPHYYLADKGAGLVYMNFSIYRRQFPTGIRVGSDHSKPTLVIDDLIAQVIYRGKTYALNNLVVWGCGSKQAFEELVLVKKRKNSPNESNSAEASTNRLHHPDRYLLDLFNGKSQSTITDS